MVAMYPLDPAPQDMRAMGEAAVAYLVDFISGLDDAPADATEGADSPGAHAGGGSLGNRRRLRRVDDPGEDAVTRTFEYAGPGYLAYIPGGGLFTAALADFIAQGVNRYVGPVDAEPGGGADRGERHALAVRPLRLPVVLAGAAALGRIDGEPVGDGDGAPREAGRRLPRRHVLRQRAGARERHEGGDDRGLREAEPAARSHGRRVADGPRGAGVD